MKQKSKEVIKAFFDANYQTLKLWTCNFVCVDQAVNSNNRGSNISESLSGVGSSRETNNS